MYPLRLHFILHFRIKDCFCVFHCRLDFEINQWRVLSGDVRVHVGVHSLDGIEVRIQLVLKLGRILILITSGLVTLRVFVNQRLEEVLGDFVPPLGDNLCLGAHHLKEHITFLNDSLVLDSAETVQVLDFGHLCESGACLHLIDPSHQSFSFARRISQDLPSLSFGLLIQLDLMVLQLFEAV